MQYPNNKKEFEIFDASKYRVGIVVATFNYSISSDLLASAQEMCLRYGIPKSNIDVQYVSGVVEIPLVLQALAQTKKFSSLVALGTIIRGDTPHFEYVAKIVSEGVLRVSLDYKIPVGFGVLTCDTLAQAGVRITVGGTATEASLQSANTLKQIEK